MNDLLVQGGPIIWIIAALSVLTVALILWKIWQLWSMGAWSHGAVTDSAIRDWVGGRTESAQSTLSERSSLRAQLALAAMTAKQTLPIEAAREETARMAKRLLHEARSGLRALDLIATIAPLLGLLGTVLDMIAAFQALQTTGARADAAVLAGGIWEALLTTAAGMAVAIPASMALTWFDSVIENVQTDMEDAATRIFIQGGKE